MSNQHKKTILMTFLLSFCLVIILSFQNCAQDNFDPASYGKPPTVQGTPTPSVSALANGEICSVASNCQSNKCLTGPDSNSYCVAVNRVCANPGTDGLNLNETLSYGGVTYICNGSQQLVAQAPEPTNPSVTITQPPQDVTARVGQSATFTVIATPGAGTTLSYQWQYADRTSPSAFIDIPGATSTSLTITPLEAQDFVRIYRVKVSATLGTTTIVADSAAAKLNLQLTAPQVVAGGEHTCAISSKDGRLYCWGRNDYRQVGDISNNSILQPTLVTEPEAKWLQVVASHLSTCALTSLGRAFCWGYNGFGQIGNNTTSTANMPTQVQSSLSTGFARPFMLLSGSHYSHCGLDTRGYAYCWGNGASGQLGTGNSDTQRRAAEVSTITNAHLISGGTSSAVGRYCVVIGDNDLRCWGANIPRSNGTIGSDSQPRKVFETNDWGTNKIIDVKMSGNHGCILFENNELRCWGLNSYGEVGNGSTKTVNIPVAVRLTSTSTSPLSVKRMALGQDHTCALTTDNKMYCWGRNNEGQLAIGSISNQSWPAEVTTGISGLVPQTLGLGQGHTCVGFSDGTIKCAGWNRYGQLGDNSQTQRTSLRQVRPPFDKPN